MNSKSVNTNHPLSPLNLADVYRQLDYVIQEKSPYLTYYRNDGSNIFEPQLVESELRVSQVDKRDEVGRLRAMEEDIDRFGVTLSLLKLALGHLFDTVSKPNSPHPIPNQHNKESSKLSLSTLRSLTGKRQLYYEVSTVYDKVQGWRLDFIKQHYELSKSLQIEGEEDGSIRSDFFLPESSKRVTLTHPTKLSPEVNPIVDFETSLGSITSSSLTRIVRKLLPTRPTPINLKAPPPPTTTTTNNNRTEQSHRSSKPNKKNGELNTNYRPERPNNKPSNKNSKLESPSTPVVLSDSDDQINSKEGKNSFMSANTYLKLSSKRSPSELNTNGTERPQKKSATHDGPNQPFINPLRKKVTESTKPTTTSRDNSFKKPHPTKPSPASDLSDDEIENERLKNIDPQMVERIKNEIMVGTENLTMDSIAGLDHAKKMVREITILPLQRPDLFTGLRRPPKGVLLFGPPGTGKTLIGKCIASQGGATFFSISSSSLTSKWIGDGEKMVRALFAVARCYQPAVVFVDEIDSLLTQRTDNEVEASRRIKTEFLVQFDGCSSLAEDRILIIGATNRPQEIDEAARRRFMKRVYIPLPELVGRRKIVSNLLARNHHDLTSEDFDKIAHLTEGYSGSDMDGLCREAALGPIRSITDFDAILHSEIRPISFPDFLDALKQVRASVDPRELDFYSEWNAKFGTLS